MEWYYIAIIVFLILAILSALLNIKPKFKYPYEKTPLLTQNELRFYKSLRNIALKYNLNVLAKVRIADIVKVESGLSRKEYTIAFNKIQSKHVDFVLASPQDLSIRMVIEVDDSSHDTAKRKQRDIFVDTLYTKVGIPILHTRDVNELEKQITSILFPTVMKPKSFIR